MKHSTHSTWYDVVCILFGAFSETCLESDTKNFGAGCPSGLCLPAAGHIWNQAMLLWDGLLAQTWPGDRTLLSDMFLSCQFHIKLFMLMSALIPFASHVTVKLASGVSHVGRPSFVNLGNYLHKAWSVTDKMTSVVFYHGCINLFFSSSSFFLRVHTIMFSA